MSPRRHRSRSACIGLALGLFAPSALGQSRTADSVDAHVKRGVELRRNGDDAAALTEFEQAHALEPSSRIRAQIGLALQALGRWRDAEEALLAALSDESDPWVREHADLLRESMAAAQHHLAWLSVESNVAGAEIAVNGASAGTLPLLHPLRVVAGATVLDVRARGYEPIRRTVDLAPSVRARESVVLVALPAIAAPERPAAVAQPDTGASRRTAGWVTLAAGGVLATGGLFASAVSAVYAGIYNDDSRCFVSPLTRDQRCGDDRGIARATLTTAVVAFSAAAIAMGTGVYLIATSSPKHATAPTASLACGAAPGFFGCAGVF
jgi:hypothetical protein